MNPKQRAFVNEYLKDHNATQAAIRAGYSKKSAAVLGHRLLKDVKVSAEIDRRTAKAGMTADQVLESVVEMAKFDPADFYNADGTLKLIHDIPRAARMAMAGLEVLEEFDGAGQERTQVGWVKKVKWTDRLRALEMLGKHHKVFTEKVEVSADDSLADLILRAGRVSAP